MYKASARKSVPMKSNVCNVENVLQDFVTDRFAGHAIKSAIKSGPVRVFSREEIAQYSCR